jgi:hypothetical protein
MLRQAMHLLRVTVESAAAWVATSSVLCVLCVAVSALHWLCVLPILFCR